MKIAQILWLTMIVGNLHGQVPQLLHYQAVVSVGGTNFNGNGQFKFALVGTNSLGQTTLLWSNSQAGTNGVPDIALNLPVSKGLYSVLLGDATLAGMGMIPSTVFTNSDVRLRVWFNNGVSGFEQLSPDQRIAAVGYAMMAASVPELSITQRPNWQTGR